MEDQDTNRELLVRIGGGAWVEPSGVRQIIAYDGIPAKFGWQRRVIQEAIKSKVVVITDQQNLTFLFDTVAEATATADWIASVVNGDHQPDDPSRDDIPEPAKVVPLRVVAA